MKLKEFDLKGFGSNVRLKRLAKCMSIEDLSKKANMSYVNLQAIETKGVVPNLRNACKIAKALSCNLEGLLRKEVVYPGGALELEYTPECCYCGHKIKNGRVYKFNDKFVCKNCIEEYLDNHMQYVKVPGGVK